VSGIVYTATGGSAQAPASGGDHRVVLVTIDGARVEEMFGGLDLEVLKSTLAPGAKVEETASYRRFWAPSAGERRQRLMPFLWRLVTEHGSIAGDPASGSAVRLSNRHWFSYPGYSEILLGEAHDEQITSNDPIRNAHTTVLEMLRARLQLPAAQVATFAGWGVFNQIVEQMEGSTLVNAGVEPLRAQGDDVRRLNALQEEATTPWANTRFDAFTFRLALEHLRQERPRVLYLALDETDDWAHDGRYEHVLLALSRTDAYLRELWMWLEAQPDYRGRTSLLMTTDHGRGHTPMDWRDHGAKVKGSDEVWIAFASPHMRQRGVWRDHAPLSTNQVAATIASWMGVDWNADHPRAGRPIR
jgi:hypothetical protein